MNKKIKNLEKEIKRKAKVLYEDSSEDIKEKEEVEWDEIIMECALLYENDEARETMLKGALIQIEGQLLCQAANFMEQAKYLKREATTHIDSGNGGFTARELFEMDDETIREIEYEGRQN